MPIETAADHPFQHISRNVNKIVEQMQKGYYNFRPNDTWAPNVNLYETEEVYLVCVDLAGVEKEKIDVEVVDNRLTLRGTRHVPTYDDGAKIRVHVMEIDHGPFLRNVELPQNMQREKISAHYRQGMLWIEIPKEK